MRNPVLMTSFFAVLVAAPGVAGADGGAPARPARPAGSVLLGLTVPDGLAIHGLDETVPLPALRVAWQAMPRISFDLGLGGFPGGYGSYMAIGHLGARWFTGDGPVGPYLVARAGIYDSSPDEGDRRVFPFIVGGGGAEYTHSSGLSLWAELAVGATALETHDFGRMSTGHDAAFAMYGSAGVGYRLGR